MILSIGLILAGFLALTVGGHYLVEGATRIALLARISTAVVGLTIVALGTSMPELAVSLGAALRGAPDISYSNVVGSNIFNLAMILGITATVRSIPVGSQTIRLEYPFMVLATWLMLLLSRDGLVDRLEGTFYVFSLVAFLWYTVRLARRTVTKREAQTLEQEVLRAAGDGVTTGSAWGRNVVIIVLGIVGLVIGSELMVRGAVDVAQALGVSQRVIGLTIVAMGTSLPELATSVVAARRGEQAIALGNVVGSNIFNILAILGVTSVIVDVPVNPTSISLDNWVMLLITVGIFPMMFFGNQVSRRDGIVLLSVFTAYMTFVIGFSN